MYVRTYVRMHVCVYGCVCVWDKIWILLLAADKEIFLSDD